MILFNFQKVFLFFKIGPKYLRYFPNFVELSMLIAYIVYFCLRINYESGSVLPSDNNEKPQFIALHSLLLVLLTIEFLVLLRAYVKFMNLIELL
jgi:hypothetical protein